jgi:hypothetical protein
MWYNLDMQLCFPTQATRDQHRRCYLTVQTSPSDALAFTFLNTGMACHMGDSSQPSWTLGHKHIAYIDGRLEIYFQSAVLDHACHELATAACANLLAWLGWLRGGELFGIGVSDVLITHPVQGPTLGLPAGMGAVQIRWQQKPSLIRHARLMILQLSHVEVAYHWVSGLHACYPTRMVISCSPHGTVGIGIAPIFAMNTRSPCWKLCKPKASQPFRFFRI